MSIQIRVCFLFVGTLGALGMVQTAEHKNSMISKVIQMLGEEKDKISANIAAETTTMAEYTQWCDDTMTEKSYAIKSANAKIADLNAVITESTAQIASLDEDITNLGNEISEREAEMEKANAIREKDHAEFLKAEAEQAEMVEEIEQLMVELKKQMNAIAVTPPPVEAEGEEAPAGLVQVGTKHSHDDHLAKMKKVLSMAVNSIWVDPESKKNLALLKKDGAFLQQGEEPATRSLDEANEEKSEDLEAFEGLKGKAEEALQRLRDEEVKKQNEHDVQMMTLKQQIALCENDLDDSKKEKARIAQEKSEAEEELVETEATKAADEKVLKSTTEECEMAAAAWTKRQSEAKAEQAAIEKAKEILASRVTVFFQKTTTLISEKLYNGQISAKTRGKLIQHFRQLGNKLHSLAMLNLVSVMSSDPMAQVKGLLKSLIEKLEKEAKEAADLHEFCKAEKAKTSKAIKKKKMTLDELDARIETASTKKETLEETIATLTDDIAEMEKSEAEATKLRNEENANFVKTVTDFTGAAEAVDDAIDALKEYYGSSFVQISRQSTKGKAPPVLGGAKSDSAGGIVSILETMGEEFRKTVKEAKAEERTAQEAYDTMMQENKVAKAAAEAEIKGSKSEIKSLKVSIHDFGEDHKSTSGELASVNEYVAKLKPQCGGRTVPYEERKAKMEAEIEGLQKGLAILEAESPAGAFSFLQIH
eukprot:gnl/MRDRNA2_/MRDRNA2_84584_c0_seq1.p1 gnl/MRDRNA2_/MRDRNA2_84584_c0~~gnl/MRDRNA2_/MRDRNA2_84584_c0_seq1.p1  ORF type:complete len:705 (+),score=285.35 gnl/MRDRNA2_/MRDRNA2_84584_c0_seq1:102-2216(+)